MYPCGQRTEGYIEITIRHAEPEDYEALHRIFAGQRAVESTLHLPMAPREVWRKRLQERPEGLYSLVACAVGGEVVGSLGLESLTRPRMRHVGIIGMAVRDDWQGHRNGANEGGAGPG